MEELDVEEVGDWLREKGFSPQVVQAFAGKVLCNVYNYLINWVEDQEMDGAAIIQTFGTCPGPDCLKEVIDKPYGTRVKVYTAIKSFLEKDLRVGLFMASLCNYVLKVMC